MDSDPISRPKALLLLPPPPSPSFDEFQQAYGAALSTVCSKLSQTLAGANSKALLHIAVSIPDALSFSFQNRARVFPYLQHFLATLYKLIGIISAEENIELDVTGGLDTRVFFLDYDPVESFSQPIRTSQYGPIVDLKSLANCGRDWDCVYYLENKTGRHLATSFSSHSSATMHPVPAGADWNRSELSHRPDHMQPSEPHYSVAVGGTFDHFHLGHKLLLTATALTLEPVSDTDSDTERVITIGVTVDELLANKKYAEYLETWNERCNSVESFLIDIIDFVPLENDAPRIQRVSQPGPNGEYILMKLKSDLSLKLVQLSDPFGPTITEESISALIVSKETSKGGAAVNAEREKKGFKDLDVFEVDLIHSGNVSSVDVEKTFESKISSTEIRRRQADLAKR
ncbi:pantetheine-phosphate adenylyltransferase family protein [Aspergillus sclerotialis]|uniref:Pantetheine-phosphate adenylyltransferase family protein n=1 Tax=Aspergillus sclerotialis TaxID=2070753 RepID=A0A3A3A2F2_9EURO|nr:pantetheine-phosphate adenylyltransferase family protein [Aspergillus sclerotialis]